MDPAALCVDRLVTVTPPVEAFRAALVTPCRRVRSTPAVEVCAFGASKSRAHLQLALIGDSHTFAWRAVLSQLGRSEGWRGYSLSTPGCMFSDAVRSLLDGPRAPCLESYRSTLRWLGRHHEIDAVITTNEADTVLRVSSDRTRAVKIAGFRRTWRSLPQNVKRLIALRDTPNASTGELACVERAAASRTEGSVQACAEPRSSTLPRDDAVEAALGLGSDRYRVVDLTDLMCSDVVCHPAVGGVLVNRDTTGHISQAFALTTAPYLLQRLEPLLP
jgi:hypothetical protein